MRKNRGLPFGSPSSFQIFKYAGVFCGCVFLDIYRIIRYNYIDKVLCRNIVKQVIIIKTIKIKFADFFQGFNLEDNFLLRAMKKNYNVIQCDDPDYLIFSCFGDENLKYDKCIKIFYSGEDVCPDFNLCDYGISFDDIKYEDRYLRYPLFSIWGMDKAMQKHIFTEDEIEAKTEFCNFVVSNGNANPIRLEFFEKLSKYKQVLSGGKFMNNIGGPVVDKAAFQEKFKFTIAFENDMSNGYTSEKILDAFKAKTIPIYWGNKNIVYDFNPKSFINVNDFSSIDEAIDYIKEIDNNDDLFRKILSEPIFENGELPYKFSADALADFFAYIIEQPLDKAKRLSKYSFKGYYLHKQLSKARYEKLMCENICYRLLHKIIK